jgi:hypothetical protein
VLIAETEPVTARLQVREIDDDEGRRLVRIIRRSSGSVVTWRPIAQEWLRWVSDRVACWRQADNVPFAVAHRGSGVANPGSRLC